MAKRNNILVVMADQLTAMVLGCHGHPLAHTPHLDAVAAGGVRFDAAYTSSPLCTPARYAMMTGQNISRCRGYDNAAYIPATMPTFAHYLRLMGYRACLSGKMHFVGPDQLHGFEERLTTDVYPADFGWVPNWHEPDERIDLWYHNMLAVKQAGVAAISNQLAYDDEVGAAALRAIYDQVRGTDERPLCLVTSFIHPHDPYAARQRFLDLYDDLPMPAVSATTPGVDDPHWRRLRRALNVEALEVSDDDVQLARRAYLANVSYVDEWLGRLLAALAECGLTETTTVVFTADHGDSLGERGLWYKMSFHEWSCRIPMVIANPSVVQARAISAPVTPVDVLPTLLDVAHAGTGAAIPDAIDALDGHSLWPAFSSRDTPLPERTVASEYLAEGTGAPMLMLREGTFKYTRCQTDPEQLFDPASDPHELTNLASATTHADRMDAFRATADAQWDADAVKADVVQEQERRRAVHAALAIGKQQAWDFQPMVNAANSYTRSHMDLSVADNNARFPRPRDV